MGLSRAERGRLAALADELALDNPRLAQALAGRCYRLRRVWRRRRRHRVREHGWKLLGYVAVLLTAGALSLLIVGLLLGEALLIAPGVLAALGATASLATMLRRRRRGQRPHAPPIPPRHRERRTT